MWWTRHFEAIWMRRIVWWRLPTSSHIHTRKKNAPQLVVHSIHLNKFTIKYNNNYYYKSLVRAAAATHNIDLKAEQQRKKQQQQRGTRMTNDESHLSTEIYRNGRQRCRNSAAMVQCDAADEWVEGCGSEQRCINLHRIEFNNLKVFNGGVMKRAQMMDFGAAVLSFVSNRMHVFVNNPTEDKRGASDEIKTYKIDKMSWNNRRWPCDRFSFHLDANFDAVRAEMKSVNREKYGRNERTMSMLAVGMHSYGRSLFSLEYLQSSLCFHHLFSHFLLSPINFDATQTQTQTNA